MIYFIIFILLLSFSVFHFFNLKKYQNNFLFSFSFLILLLFAGLRWKTGTDWYPYFDYFKTLTKLIPFEPGFQLFTYIIRLFTNNYTIYLFIISFASLIVDFSFIKKFSPYPLISIFIFYSTIYFDFFGGIRVILAISLCFLGIRYLVQQYVLTFIFIIIIGTSIHLSTFIFLLAIFFRNLYIKNFYFIGLFVLSLILSYLQIVNLFINFLITTFSSHFAIIGKLSYYLNSDYIPNGTDVFLHNIFAIIKRSLFIIIFILYRKQTEGRFINFNFFFNLYFISVFLYIITIGNIEMLKRGSIFFAGFEMILLPMVIYSVNKQNKIVILSITMIYCLFRLITQLETFPNLYFPYKSIFEF